MSATCDADFRIGCVMGNPDGSEQMRKFINRLITVLYVDFLIRSVRLSEAEHCASGAVANIYKF